MKIYSVTDAAFRPYGKILEGYDTAPLCAAMRSIPMPEQGTAYEPSIPVLEECALHPWARCFRRPLRHWACRRA